MSEHIHITAIVKINQFFSKFSTLVYFSTKYISVKGYYDVNKNIILLTV